MKNILIVLILYGASSCNGQEKNQNCNKREAYDKVIKLKEIVKDISLNKKIIFDLDEEVYKKKDYFVIREQENGEFHNSVWNIFYIDKKTCSLYYYDTVSGNLLTIEQWRNTSDKPKKNSMKDIEFGNLFNEGTNIEFTPNDLDKSNPEILEFKEKLSLYVGQHPLPDDFEIDNLESLINNETFINNESYVDSSWLDYFINKYKINHNSLYDLLDAAIEKEDYNAVEIIVGQGCIISKKEIKDAELSLKYYESLNGKIDTEEFYDPSFSQISKIYPFLKSRFLKNHIQDPDVYTNLRKEKNASSEILQRIKSGENIEVLDNTGDWFLIKTKQGKTGYVHKSRIRSGNNKSASIQLYQRPDFSSFSWEAIAKGEIEIVHETSGWDCTSSNQLGHFNLNP